MAQITITIPNNKLNRVVDAIAIIHGYKGKTAELSSKPSKQQFAKQQLVEWIKECVKQVEYDKAAMRQEIEQDADTLNIT